MSFNLAAADKKGWLFAKIFSKLNDFKIEVSLFSPFFVRSTSHWKTQSNMLRNCKTDQLTHPLYQSHIQYKTPAAPVLSQGRHIDSKQDYYSPPGADLEGGRTRRVPPLFFAEIGRLTLCECPTHKECTKLCELTLKITIFLRFWGATSPSDTPCPHRRRHSISPYFGRPLFLKILDLPLPPLT